MKKSAALLSPIIIASLLGTASAGSIELVEHYEEASAPNQTVSSARSSMNTALRSVEKLNAAQGSEWKANLDRRSGTVRTLYGSNSKSYGSDPEKVAKSFLKESSEVFGLRSDLANIKTLRVDKTEDRDHVRFQQMHNGIPVNGAIMLVHSNKNGQVTMAQSSYASEIVPINSREISQEKAVKTVMDDLQASVQGGASFGEARAEEMVESINDKYYFIWKVTVSSKDPFGFWVYFIDAKDAKVLYKNNEIVSLRTGYGRVYKNNHDCLVEKFSVVPLRQLFTENEDYFTGGLWGKHVDVYDYEFDEDQANDPYAPNLKFLYNPYGAQKPWFDATNLYYKLDATWRWWKNNVIGKFGPKHPDYFYSLSIPAIVNFNFGTEGEDCNAFYLPKLQDNYPPGFVFGDENNCAADSKDFSLDDDVITHEFTHAMMEWSFFGKQFGGPLNGYGRAMGEGNADWFAYLRTKDPIMAEVAFAWTYEYGGEGYLRNLDNTRMYPADVNDPTYGATYKDKDAEVIIHHLPEEHYTGEIFGGYLYDLTQILKKKALPYVYRGMYYFSPAGGFKKYSSDFYDAILAQAMAEKDRTGKLTNTIKVWGAMSSRGLLGNIRSTYSSSCYFPGSLPVCKKEKIGDIETIICEPCSLGSDTPAYFSLRLNGQTTLSTQSKFLKPGICNEYPIDIANSGVNLKVTVAGTGTVPSIKLYDASAQVIANSADNTLDQAILNVPGIPASSYTIMACAGAANTGKYTIQVATTAQ